MAHLSNTVIDTKRGKFYFPLRVYDRLYDAHEAIVIAHPGLTNPFNDWRFTTRTGHYYVNASHRWAYFINNLKEPMTDYAREVIDFLLREVAARKERILAIKTAKDNVMPLPWTVGGEFTPYEHQVEAVNVMIDVKRVPLWADCGLGKTYICIQTITGLKHLGLPHKTLVVCPKSLVTGAWTEDIEKFSDLSYFNLREKEEEREWTGERGEPKRPGLLGAKKYKVTSTYLPIPDDKDVYIANYDIVARRLKEFLKLGCDVIILDESSRLKNPEGIQAKAVKKLSMKVERCYQLTGSAAPNGIKDLWMQMYINDNGATLGNSFFDFRAATHHAIKGREGSKLPVGQVIWKETSSGIGLARRQVAPVVLRYKKDECLDLPDKVFANLGVDLSPKQIRHYNEIVDNLVTRLEGGEVISIPNRLVEFAKLQQVTGGFIVDQEMHEEGGVWKGYTHMFKENPKLDRLMDHVADIEGKILIWAWFRAEVEMIAKALGCKYIHGGVPDKKRATALDGFKHGNDRIMVANPATIGHGHTLVAGHYAIYYSNGFNYELRHQSIERLHRIGQKSTCFYYDIVARKSVDERILKALLYKKGVQEFAMNPLPYLRGL